MKTRALILALIVIIVLLLAIVLFAAALLHSTGNPPEGEVSRLYEFAYPLVALLERAISVAGEVADAIASQIARLSGNL